MSIHTLCKNDKLSLEAYADAEYANYLGFIWTLRGKGMRGFWGKGRKEMEVERMIAPNFTRGFCTIKLKPSYMEELKKIIREVVLRGFGKFFKSHFSFIRLSKETNIKHKHSSFPLLYFFSFSQTR